MSQNIPNCISAISLLAPLAAAAVTLLVGIVVALIAYRQWRVAHEKLILDLFDKRFAVYSDAREAVRGYWAPIRFDPSSIAKRLDPSTYGARMQRIETLHDVGRRAQFLFGDEVAARIKVVRDALIEGTPSTPMEEEDDELRRQNAEARKRALKESQAFPKDLDALVSKYMRITRAL
ncbi:hypothetical protein [Mesorhizobium sp. A623]